MGERKGQNKYYPPDFDYKVHKSLAGYHGQHPLRERARKLDKGILIIRFEMPYNIWCDGCNNHIGMGVRYNAEKSKDGMYYTTPIYKFRMKCHLCDNHFEIKTDPANQDYVIISGARRKEQRWDPHENEQIVPEDRATQKQLAMNAMYKLEHGEDDRVKGKSNQSAISQLLEHQERQKDDFALNQLARKQFRDKKKVLLAEQLKDEAITKKYGLNVKLVKEHADDVRLSKLLKFATSTSAPEDRRDSVKHGVLFSPERSISSSDSISLSGTKKDISIKRLQQIASSDVTKKRSEAFLSSPSDGGDSFKTEITSRVTLLRKQKPESVTDDSASKSLPQSNGGDVSSLTNRDSSCTVTKSALSVLCNNYTDGTDEDDDDDDDNNKNGS